MGWGKGKREENINFDGQPGCVIDRPRASNARAH